MGKAGEVKLCIIGVSGKNKSRQIEGGGNEDILKVFNGEVLGNMELNLNLFPVEVMDPTESDKSQEMKKNDLKIFCKFVHHSTLNSKPKIVEEIRMQHPTIISSKAQAWRTLDMVAQKRKNINGGVIWDVKEEVLKNLGLEDLLAEKISMPDIKSPMVTSSGSIIDKEKSTKRSSDGEIGKRKRIPEISSASANLFAAYLKKTKVISG